MHTTDTIQHTSLFSSSILYLNKTDILQIDGDSSALYTAAVHHAFMLHANGQSVQPLKPYLRWDSNGQHHIADRIIAMPAYLGGNAPVAGLKWVGSKHDNPVQRGIERASALVILNDPQTNYPIAILEGSRINAMRTGAVTSLAASYLAKKDFSRVSCIGCGPIGTAQLFTLFEQFPTASHLYLFDRDATVAQHLVENLQQRFPQIEYSIMATAKDALQEGEVVLLCTTTDQPYVSYDFLQKGAFVSNVSLMDVHKDVFTRADKVVVDDWMQCNREGKVINLLVEEGLFSFEQIHAELGDLVNGRRPGRETDEEIILFNPMGLAIEDIACAQAIYQRAIEKSIGTWLNLY